MGPALWASTGCEDGDAPWKGKGAPGPGRGQNPGRQNYSGAGKVPLILGPQLPRCCSGGPAQSARGGRDRGCRGLNCVPRQDVSQ